MLAYLRLLLGKHGAHDRPALRWLLQGQYVSVDVLRRVWTQ